MRAIEAFMKLALVTGGCGFLGSAIVRSLRQRGVAVRVLALPAEPTDNVSGLEVEIVRGDVRNIADCKAAVAGVDTLFHAAAIYLAWAPDPSRMYEVNLKGTFNMLEAARREGVQTTVYTASIVSLGRSPMGANGPQLANEDTRYDVWKLDFPYSRAKLHSRQLAEHFAAWGMDVRVVCPGIVFGPGDIGPTPSGKLILEALSGQAPPVYVGGGASYVDVRDAAEVHVLAAEKGSAGERYVASGTNLSNQELIETINRVAGISRKLIKAPTPMVRAFVAAINKYAARTGTEPPLSREFFEYSLVPSYFDASKSVRELGASYRPIEQTIADAIAYFRATGRLPPEAGYASPVDGTVDGRAVSGASTTSQRAEPS